MLPMQVRIKFTKTGTLQFISHLDLNRTMKSIMLRAKLPVHYSEGFNPHPKITFGLPLSIGAESVCEYMDFKLDSEITYSEIKNRLNNALPPEMRVLDAYCPERSLSDITFAGYDIISENEFDYSALSSESIIVPKRTKKGVFDTDIKPMIRSYKLFEKRISVILAANPEVYLNPEYIAKILNLTDYSIMRTDVYYSVGNAIKLFR